MSTLPTFSNIDELLFKFDRATKQIAEKNVQPKVKQILQDKIEQTVYHGNHPYGGEGDYYQRTGEFLYSTTSDYYNRNEGSLTVLSIDAYNDGSLMSTPHRSWVSPFISQNDNLAKWLDQGHGGIASYSAQNFYKLAQGELELSAFLTLRIQLRKYGFSLNKK